MKNVTHTNYRRAINYGIKTAVIFLVSLLKLLAVVPDLSQGLIHIVLGDIHYAASGVESDSLKSDSPWDTGAHNRFTSISGRNKSRTQQRET